MWADLAVVASNRNEIVYTGTANENFSSLHMIFARRLEQRGKAVVCSGRQRRASSFVHANCDIHPQRTTTNNMPVRPTRKRRTKRNNNNNRLNIEEEEFLAMAMCPPSAGSPALSRSDLGVAQTMNSIAHLERCIARILLLRYQQDIVRLYSTRLHNVALECLPKLVHQCAVLTGPGWVAYNADGEEIKDFFRGAIAMDLRQSGERVATKSVLWSYTALRHFVGHSVPPLHPSQTYHALRLYHIMFPYAQNAAYTLCGSYPTTPS